MTNWRNRLSKITENINDTIPSSKKDKLKERYKEALLKKTELTMKENKDVMKKIKYHLDQIKIPLSITAYRN